MAVRTAEERLAELQERRKREEERLAKLKAQERDLLKKQKEQERKQRTRRLILCGAAVEKALGRPVNVEEGEEKELAAVIAASDEKKASSDLAFAQAISNILGREVTGNDLVKIKSFLQFQEDRGNYFSKWMNRES